MLAAFVFGGSTLGDFVLVKMLGFALATLAYAAAVTRVFTTDRRLLVGVPLVVTLALFVFFRVALGVRLPGGPFA